MVQRGAVEVSKQRRGFGECNRMIGETVCWWGVCGILQRGDRGDALGVLGGGIRKADNVGSASRADVSICIAVGCRIDDGDASGIPVMLSERSRIKTIYVELLRMSGDVDSASVPQRKPEQ